MPSPSSVPSPPAVHADSPGDDAEDLAATFRPLKKRKIYRSRAAAAERESSPLAPPLDSVTTSPPSLGNGTAVSPDSSLPATKAPGDPPPDALSQLRKQRAALARKQRGIEFGADAARRPEQYGVGGGNEGDGAGRDTDDKTITGASDRFAPQRGHAANVDRHMYVSDLFLPMTWLLCLMNLAQYGKTQ
jgi:hypothetical protein